ncbi:hypothetical protein BJV82DRAFT_672646 [Fennellomyces sp. T-0311]|nr:hypothetical protein BJV82DRAFT_672646 [Fennellomyces sp. T-0311]
MDRSHSTFQKVTVERSRQLIERLNNTIKSQNCEQIVNDASAAIDQLHRVELLSLLDIRAHAHAKRGCYDLAHTDAQQMINYAPHLAAGYVRKGDIFSMYGHQTQAINTYSEGLEKAALDQTQLERLSRGIINATAISQIRIDYLAKLPVEVAYIIIRCLSQDAKASCLTVSSTWRKRTLECPNSWSSISIKGREEDYPLVGVTRHLAPYIHCLELDFSNRAARSIYFRHMKDSYFTSIKYLKLTASTTRKIRLNIATVLIGLWQIRDTLTELSLEFANDENIITISEVLSTCTTLNDLSYTTGGLLSEALGDLTQLEHHPLSLLQLRSEYITGGDVEGILRICEKLRRLVVSDCDDTVLDTVRQEALNLEILGYNTVYHVPYPEEETLDGQESGLRVIKTNNGGDAVDAFTILALIHKHMRTLHHIVACTSSFNDMALQHLNTAYQDFKLENVVSLKFWCSAGIQQFMLKAIRNTLTLRSLHVVHVHDLKALVDTLMKLPRLIAFKLTCVHTTGNHASLVQLLEHYARLDDESRQLECVEFRDCFEVTDEVLCTLTDIKAVKHITLWNLYHVTTAGVIQFIQDLTGNLTSLTIRYMDLITDKVMSTLGASRVFLKNVHLQDLKNITDQGLRDLVDRRSNRLNILIVKKCPFITAECIKYVKQKVNTVEYVP